MDLQHVRYFVQIAQFGSVTKAAEANFISQPALSRILSALEDEVGVPLFIRQGKKLVLNHYGEIFLSAAIKSINLLDKANQDIISLRTATSGRIEVRMNILPPRFTELCTRFQSAYPNIELNVSHTGSNATDLGDIFFYNPPIDIGGRTSAKLIEEKFVAAVLPGHPLASATQVDLKTLAAYKLMILNPEGMKKSVYSAFFIHGLFPTVVEVSTHAESINIYMQVNNPVAILPVNYAVGCFPDYVLIDIVPPGCTLSFNMAWDKENLSDTVSTFLSFVLDFYQDPCLLSFEN